MRSRALQSLQLGVELRSPPPNRRVVEAGEVLIDSEAMRFGKRMLQTLELAPTSGSMPPRLAGAAQFARLLERF